MACLSPPAIIIIFPQNHEQLSMFTDNRQWAEHGGKWASLNVQRHRQIQHTTQLYCAKLIYKMNPSMLATVVNHNQAEMLCMHTAQVASNKSENRICSFSIA